MILTRRQADVLAVVRAFTAVRGYPPTVRQLAECMVGLGPNSWFAVQQHIAALVRKGYLRRQPGLSRSLVVIER